MRMLDLFCGELGWSAAFAARGWDCVCVDIFHPRRELPLGCEFRKMNVLSITNIPPDYFDFICVSSPCEEFSVFSMPHFHPKPKHPASGIQLFEHARRICEESGLPYVMENVRAAQEFVGNAVSHCGPFYLWGNAVPPLLPQGIKKGFQTGGQIIQRLKAINRKALTDYRRLNDGSWSSSKSEKRKEWTAKVATIPPELAGCVADYATRICTDGASSKLMRRELVEKTPLFCQKPSSTKEDHDL